MQIHAVIIGSGPVGIRAAEDISACQPQISISMFGDEPVEPYNRVQLSNYLSGKESFNDLRLIPKLDKLTTFKSFYHDPVTAINPAKKLIETAGGNSVCYDKLVIATGSHAYVPQIPNIKIDGVFTLRTLTDADTLKARKSAVTIVLGGGLLGLETARAIHLNAKGKTRVIVVDHSLNLMSRQLNNEAGDLLKEKVLQVGIEVILANGIKNIIGTDMIEGVKLRDEQIIACDTLVLAVGIRPSKQLAEQGELKTRHGIVVNEKLQTSNPDIYAVGECAEFEQITYGIIAPGYEQAKIMAAHLCAQKNQRRYRGSILATQLKVLDYPVFSMGQVGENVSGVPLDRYDFTHSGQHIYRHLIIDRRQLKGCIALGDWSELNRIRTAIENRKKIWPWQLKRFQNTGLIWSDEIADSVIFWPDHEIVCNCNQVTRGELGQAVVQGCKTVTQLSAKTDAGTTCGSCHTLLSDLLGCQVEPVKAYKILAGISFVTLLSCLIYVFTPRISFQQIATIEWHFDVLWRDNFIKQVTGYALLASSVIVSGLSFRKRVKKFTFGHFGTWRMIHAALGCFSLFTLLAHTGFRLGENINQYLMMSYVGLLFVGSFAGLVIAGEHQMNPGLARTLRSQFIWLHILLFWPLPLLLGFHVLQTYYF